MVGCKKFWVISDGYGWFRVVSDGFGWFTVLVVTVVTLFNKMESVKNTQRGITSLPALNSGYKKQKLVKKIKKPE